MKKCIWIFVVVCMVAFMGAGALWAQSFMPGRWTITMVTQIEGMEEQIAQAAVIMQSLSPEEKAMMGNMTRMIGGLDIEMDLSKDGMITTITECLTEKNPVPNLKEVSSCQMTQNTNGNTTNFEAVCPQGTVAGHINYKKSTMTGQMTSRQKVNGKDTNANITMTGHYVGPCKE